ncbi:MAG: hypothetical protein IKN55_04060 [Oscillospiraceae bacterium]|nr:hypothetical protein [Oscillospiraceae bacterium]
MKRNPTEPGEATAHYAKCRGLIAKYRRNLRIRLVLLTVFLLTGIFMDAYLLSLPHLVACILCSVGVLALAFLVSHENLWLYILLLAAIAFFTTAKIFPWSTGAIALVIYLTAVPEYAKMSWIRLQPGYPHFSERFDMQLAHPDYEPEEHGPAMMESVLEELPEGAADAIAAPPQTEMPALEIPDIPALEELPENPEDSQTTS